MINIQRSAAGEKIERLFKLKGTVPKCNGRHLRLPRIFFLFLSLSFRHSHKTPNRLNLSSFKCKLPPFIYPSRVFLSKLKVKKRYCNGTDDPVLFGINSQRNNSMRRRKEDVAFGGDSEEELFVILRKIESHA